MLTDVYIDRDTKKVIGGSIVPLYTYAPSDGNFRAVPVYEIMNDTELRRQLTTDDIDRAANAHGITTRVVFGHEMDIASVTDPYCDLTFTEKTELNNEYSAELEKYCKEKSLMYINANENIRAALSVAPERKYLLDHIHPNASTGVIMYSEAVLSAKTR